MAGHSHHDGPANRLAQEKSPYVLQHAHNPVDWYPWGEEAFKIAKETNRLVFLSENNGPLKEKCLKFLAENKQIIEQNAIKNLSKNILLDLLFSEFKKM